jgi:hypothetical protein
MFASLRVLVGIVAEDVLIHTNFTTLQALFHLADPKDLEDNFDVARMLQAALGVASNLLQLVGSNAMASELADNVEQKLNAVFVDVSDG